MELKRLQSIQKQHRRKKRFSHSFKLDKLIQIAKTTVFLILVLGLFVSVHAGLKLGVQFLKTSNFFALQEIKVIGNYRLSQEEVAKLTGLKPQVNLLTIDLKEIGKRIGRNPWVQELSLRRILPGTLRIKIREHWAVSLLLTDHLYFVDSNGRIIKQAEPGEDLDLPVISGLSEATPEGIRPALTWMNKAHFKQVIPLTHLSEIHVEENQRLSIFTMGPAIKILAEATFTDDQLHRLKLILNDLRQRGMIPRQIDLNYNKKVVVKLKKSQ